MKISLFKTSKDTKPETTLTISEFIKRIKKGEWEPWINKIRNTKDEAVQKKIKNGLPAVTLAGVCNGRAIQKSSGYIGIDVDAQDNGKDLLSKIPKLQQDPFIHAVWKSSRGSGIWMLFKINYKQHVESFLGIEEYLFRNYGIVADSQCKDNSRLCFVSYDPECYFKQGKKVFKKLGKITAIPGPDAAPTDIIDYNEVKILTQQIVDARKDITHNYHDWLRIGLIYAELGSKGRELYHKASQFYKGYDVTATDLQFNKCLKTVATDRAIKGSKRASIRTLSHLMLKAGITPKVVKTKPAVHNDIAVQENTVVYADKMRDEGKNKFTFGLLEFKMVGKDEFKCTGASTARVAEWLYKQGFRAYHDKIYYHIENNIVEEIGASQIYNKVFLEIKKIPKGVTFRFDGEGESITRDMAMEAAQKNIKQIVDAIPMDTSFDPDDRTKFLRDTDKQIYLKFENCLVIVDSKRYKIEKYANAPGLVWRRSIRPYSFEMVHGTSDVQKILDKAIGLKNKNAYMTAIGYMLSTFFPPEGSPMLFCCDLNLEGGINAGGNGKDFMKQILAQFREVTTIPSKSLDLKREFALHMGNKDTEIFWFEDLNRATKMDQFYNFSNGVTVRRLHTQAFTVHAKIGVSLQHTIDMEGNSNARRQIFLLFENYFGKLKDGIKEEFGRVFGEDWSIKKRGQFNAFIIECCQLYLEKGVIKMSTEKLSEARKDELGDELYSQLTLETKYTSRAAMDAVSKGYDTSEMSQKYFVDNWRKWCEHMGYDLILFKTKQQRYYVMQKKVTLKLGKKNKEKG